MEENCLYKKSWVILYCMSICFSYERRERNRGYSRILVKPHASPFSHPSSRVIKVKASQKHVRELCGLMCFESNLVDRLPYVLARSTWYIPMIERPEQSSGYWGDAGNEPFVNDCPSRFTRKRRDTENGNRKDYSPKEVKQSPAVVRFIY